MSSRCFFSLMPLIKMHTITMPIPCRERQRKKTKNKGEAIESAEANQNSLLSPLLSSALGCLCVCLFVALTMSTAKAMAHAPAATYECSNADSSWGRQGRPLPRTMLSGHGTAKIEKEKKQIKSLQQ